MVAECTAATVAAGCTVATTVVGASSTSDIVTITRTGTFAITARSGMAFARSVTPLPVRVAGPCTCLSKEYTPDGRVLFKDLCTNEAAINPPVVAPQQSSSIDAPVQQASNVQYQTAPANLLPHVDPMTGQPK